MPAPSSYDYAIVRLVPRVERGEWINVGIVLFCRTRRFLAGQIELDPARLHAFAPALDLPTIEQHLAVIPKVASATPDSGPIGRLPLAERFHWLVAPRSAMIQVSPVHVGLCTDPAGELARLIAALVRTSPR